MDIETLRQRMSAAMADDDEAGYLALIHPDVVFTTVAFGDRQVFHGRAGAAEWWARRERSVVYDAYSAHAELIAPNAVLIEGRLRHAESGQGMEDAPARWLVVERDGLVWRYQPVESREDALVVMQTLAALD